MSMCYLIGGGLIVRRRRLFRPLQFSAESKERNEVIKIQSAFAPAIRFSPVIILRLLLFVSFGTWFPSRSARVGVVWHMAAVRVLYRDRRRHRLRNLLKQEIRREPDDATYLSIVNLFIDRSIRRCYSPSHPGTHLDQFHFGGQSLRLPSRALLMRLKGRRFLIILIGV